VFHALDEKDIKSIARIQLGYLEKRLAALDLKLEVTDAVLSELAQAGFDPVFGARPLKRAIQHNLENPLAKEILEGHFAPKDTIVAERKDGHIVFARQPRSEAKAA
jgi:ATP-dependent Clp protease ATP-binding subunit ClpB